MATPGVGFDVATKLTKKIFDGNEVMPQMIVATPYLDARKRKSIALGTDVTQAIQAEFAQGFGVRGDREALPEAGAPVYDNPTWDTVMEYGRIQITGKSWRRTEGDVRAFAPALGMEIKGAVKGFFRDMEYQLLADGTGKRITTSGTLSQGASVTVTPASGQNVRGIFQGMKVDIYDSNTVYVETDKVTSVDRVNNTFVLDAVQAVSIATGAFIIRQGNYNREVNGLSTLVNNSSGPATVLGIASSNAYWQSTVLSNGGVARALVPELLDQGYLSSSQQNGTDPDEAWMDYVQYRKLLELHTRPEIFANGTGKSMNLNLGNKVPAWNKAEVKISTMVMPGAVYFLQGEDIMIRDNSKFTWITEPDGKNIWHYVPGYDQYEAVFIWDLQQTVGRRNLHCAITDLALS